MFYGFEINYNHACGNVKMFVQVQLGHLTQVNTTIVNLNICIAYVMLIFPPETCLSIIIFKTLSIISKNVRMSGWSPWSATPVVFLNASWCDTAFFCVLVDVLQLL